MPSGFVALPGDDPEPFEGVEGCNCVSCRDIRRETEAPSQEMRTCQRCGQRQSLGQFSLRGRGRSHTCTDCTDTLRAATRRMRKHGRRFGVEIEFVHPHADCDGYGIEDMGEEVADQLSSISGVEVEWQSYNHATPSTWKLVTDSSVPNGYELVSPPLTWADRDQVTELCFALGEIGMEAASTCGLHVHHEVADLKFSDFRSLVGTWQHAQRHTSALVSRSRRNTRWAAPWRAIR